MGRKKILWTPEEKVEHQRINRERKAENQRKRRRLHRDVYTTGGELSVGVSEQFQLVGESSSSCIESAGGEILQCDPVNRSANEEDRIQRKRNNFRKSPPSLQQ